uniref:Uncharacterized protein n=1 Tax=Glossina palpalis gambiensis TaxID=67801 RepID=A0A1B0BK87_9MUSC
MLLLENSHQCIYNDSTENDSCSFHQLAITQEQQEYIAVIITITVTVTNSPFILRAEASKAKHDLQIITESTDVLLKDVRMDIMYYNNSSNNELKAATSSLVSSLGIFQFIITFVILYSAFSDALSRVSLCRSQSRILNTQTLNGQRFRSILLRSTSYTDNAKLKCNVAICTYLIRFTWKLICVHLVKLTYTDLRFQWAVELESCIRTLALHKTLQCVQQKNIYLKSRTSISCGRREDPVKRGIGSPAGPATFNKYILIAIEAKLIAVWDKNVLRRANISQMLQIKKKNREIETGGVKCVVSNRYHRKPIVIVTVFSLLVNMQPTT